jgi:hypothetical protein
MNSAAQERWNVSCPLGHGGDFNLVSRDAVDHEVRNHGPE